ncbi:MAG: succinylglutamate-semialdehyde dehydrogenase [Opitutaceae bacterium]|nr:succinylglutamate-semialdehyde dehydrogenase [Opitutaceae bacterium]
MSTHPFTSRDPATGEVVWRGAAASAADIAAAVAAARAAFPAWAGRSLEERTAVLRAFAGRLDHHRAALATAISREVGKPRWEALTEVQAMIGKVEHAVRAYAQRCAEFRGGPAVTRFRPHGVIAVLGPFNFPGHLPNGHTVPALLAGNVVVFKPSERAPGVAELTAELWREAGLPAGVLTVVQGGRDTGAALAAHPGVDGLCFTGSSDAGQRLAELFARTPGRMLALELGGNNPLVVWSVRDRAAAARLVVESAYLTAGQRCTCARRLIVPDGRDGDALLEEVMRLLARVRVGAFTADPEPFMGPVITAEAAAGLVAAQVRWVAAGARVLVPLRHLRAGTGLVAPGLIDVTPVLDRPDTECFGPLLQVIRVPDFDAALREANATRFGLAAGLLSDEAARYQQFRDSVRAGIVNWNQPLTGASSAAPFGGVGASGNHRPSGFFAADYCAFPVASIEAAKLNPDHPLPPGIEP